MMGRREGVEKLVIVGVSPKTSSHEIVGHN